MVRWFLPTEGMPHTFEGKGKQMSKRYEITLKPSLESGIRCVYVEVNTKTRTWSNGPINTETTDFLVLTPEARRAVNYLAKQYEGLERLLEAAEKGGVKDVDPLQVRLVMANCKTNSRYLYASGTEEFLSEANLIAFAKEGEEFLSTTSRT
jgi:hypothetical protein